MLIPVKTFLHISSEGKVILRGSFTLSPPPNPSPTHEGGMVKGILWFTSLEILLKVNRYWLSSAMLSDYEVKSK